MSAIPSSSLNRRLAPVNYTYFRYTPFDENFTHQIASPHAEVFDMIQNSNIKKKIKKAEQP